MSHCRPVYKPVIISMCQQPTTYTMVVNGQERKLCGAVLEQNVFICYFDVPATMCVVKSTFGSFSILFDWSLSLSSNLAFVNDPK